MIYIYILQLKVIKDIPLVLLIYYIDLLLVATYCLNLVNYI
jgi:hypothetical protein